MHAHAAFVTASTSSCNLVGCLINQTPSPSPVLDPAIAALSTSADWQLLEIDVLTTQHHLSLAIDNAVHHQLLSLAPSNRVRALAHARDWLNGCHQPPWASTSKTDLSNAVSGIGWVSPSTVFRNHVQSVTALQTNLVTTRWEVEGTVAASPAIMPFWMSYSQLLNLQLWLQFGSPLHDLQIPFQAD